MIYKVLKKEVIAPEPEPEPENPNAPTNFTDSSEVTLKSNFVDESLSGVKVTLDVRNVSTIKISAETSGTLDQIYLLKMLTYLMMKKCMI